MATLPDESNGPLDATPSIDPYFYLLSAVLLLGIVPTITKYVFLHSTVDPFGMAFIRVTIGFIFLLALTLSQDRRGLSTLTAGICPG